MAVTYEPIASVTLESDSQPEFTEIPSTFTDLVVVVNYGLAQANDPMVLRVGNGGVDTASNYSNTTLQGNGSSVSSYRDSNMPNMAAGTYYLGASTLIEHFSVIHLMSYSSTNIYKTILVESGSAVKGAERDVSLWRSTASITNIKFGAATGMTRNIKAGSTFSLYGIKAA